MATLDDRLTEVVETYLQVYPRSIEEAAPLFEFLGALLRDPHHYLRVPPETVLAEMTDIELVLRLMGPLMFASTDPGDMMEFLDNDDEV